ncbi:MAG: MFS transporter, partial [Oxalobacteraceae bacterium]
MKSAYLKPQVAMAPAAAPFTVRQQYTALFGSWLGWLFDALDAGIFGFVMLAIAHSFGVQMGDVVSTVAWFLLATGIGGYFLGNISDRIGRKKTILASVLAYGTGTLLCGFAGTLFELNV